MQRLGAPKELIESINESRVIKILPMNWSIVVWFTEVSDLMRWRSDGQCLGFDVVQVKGDAEISGRFFTTKQYQGLRIMGKAAARKINGFDDE